MESRVERGYLVLADISGFTHFVAGSELDHSQAILSEILKVIIRNFTPILTVAEVEGDAVFGYAPQRDLARGETLLEVIEATYLAFRDKRESARRMATCPCKACQMIPGLDLKFLTHYGEYILQEVNGKKKPLGSSVNLVHRLLKNSVSPSTGWRGYALFTEESMKRMDVFPLNMHAQVEHYEHLGNIETYSVNLDDRYRELTDARRVVIEPRDAHVVLSRKFEVDPPLLWEWLNDPHLRSLWRTGSLWHAVDRPQGRTSRGATNHCSNSDSLELILDWRPFTYYTVEITHGLLRFTCTQKLEGTDEGTHLSYRVRFNGSLPEWIRRRLCKFMILRMMKEPQNLDLLAKLLTDEREGKEREGKRSAEETNRVAVGK